MPSCYMYIGEELARGAEVPALNNDYFFSHQFDGNLVIYKADGNEATWSSGTAGLETTHLKLEKDGNFILYNGKKKVWELDLSTVIRYPAGPPYVAIMQDNGEVALNDKELNYLGGFGEGESMHHGTFDHSKIACGGAIPWGGSIFTLYRTAAVNFTPDGGLQFQVNEGEPKYLNLFKGATVMAMQHDGNLVMYNDSAKPVYDWNMKGSGAKAVMVLNNGDMVLVDDETVMPDNCEGHIIKTLVSYDSLK